MVLCHTASVFLIKKIMTNHDNHENLRSCCILRQTTLNETVHLAVIHTRSASPHHTLFFTGQYLSTAPGRISLSRGGSSYGVGLHGSAAYAIRVCMAHQFVWWQHVLDKIMAITFRFVDIFACRKNYSLIGWQSICVNTWLAAIFDRWLCAGILFISTQLP